MSDSGWNGRPRGLAPKSGRRSGVRNLSDLRPLVRIGRYRLGSHAIKHAASEGFTESDVVNTVLYGRELARYWEDERLLVLGHIPASPTVKIPLHVVLEYSRPRWVDIVTAFIPLVPHKVVSRARLAEILRYDRHAARRTIIGPRR